MFLVETECHGCPHSKLVSALAPSLGVFSISPEGVKIKNTHYDLDEITATRWGATKHTVNGIPSGTTYSITIGSRKGYETLEFRDGTVFENFVGCLWKAIGVRLFTEYLEALKDGQKLRFGSVTVNDFGIELERSNFFSANEKIYCRAIAGDWLWRL